MVERMIPSEQNLVSFPYSIAKINGMVPAGIARIIALASLNPSSKGSRFRIQISSMGISKSLNRQNK
jgi:flagellar basal body P-ring protein FlgI